MSVRFTLVIPAQDRLEAMYTTRDYLKQCWFQIERELPVLPDAQKACGGTLHLYEISVQINDSANMVDKEAQDD